MRERTVWLIVFDNHMWQKMRIIVIGLGSMGKRRIRLMKQYSEDIEIIGVDSNKDRIKEVKEKYNIDSCESLQEVCKHIKPDGAFVCTSPLSHCEIISTLIKKGINVFTEINLVSDGYDSFINEKKVKLFLSSTFLYRKDIQWIMSRVRDEKVNYIYHTGQYLPDWHPWENYKDFFVGDVRTNGCREILAIEMPWIRKCFGKIKKINVLKDKMTSLQIDYADNYLIQLEHENGNKGTIAVDVVARRAMRRLEVFNENMHIFWDGTPSSLSEYDCTKKEVINIETYDDILKDNNYCENIIENAYMEEIDAFLAWINGNKQKVKYSFEEDYEILNIIDKIEQFNV